MTDPKSPFGEGLFEYLADLTRAQDAPAKASLHRAQVAPAAHDLELALSHVLDRDGWTVDTLLTVPGVYTAVSAYLREEVLEYLADDLEQPVSREEN
jgi:hypothetical protein